MLLGLALVRVVGRYRVQDARRQSGRSACAPCSAAALREAARRASATPAAAGRPSSPRARSALRIGGAVALGRPVAQRSSSRHVAPHEGQLGAAQGLLRPRRRARLDRDDGRDDRASRWRTTNGRAADARTRSDLEGARASRCRVFSVARYGRDQDSSIRRRSTRRSSTASTRDPKLRTPDAVAVRTIGSLHDRRQRSAEIVMVPLRELLYAVRDTLDEWLSAARGRPAFRPDVDAMLVLVVLHRDRRADAARPRPRTQKAGRTHIALPAVLPVMRRSRFSVLRHAAFLVFLPACRFSRWRWRIPHTSFTREETSYPGRRIALLVDASTSMVMKFETKPLKTPENRAFYTAVAAAEHFMKLRMNGRYHDLIALIQFGNEAYVVTPFTTDYENILLSIRLISNPQEWGSFTDWGTTIMQGLDQAHAAVQDVRLRERLRQPDDHVHRRSRRREGPQAASSIQSVIDEMQKYKIPIYMIRTGFDLNAKARFRRTSCGSRSSSRLAAGSTRPTAKSAILARRAEIDKLSTGRIDVREYTAQRPRFAGYALDRGRAVADARAS